MAATMDAFSSSKYFEEPVPDLTFPGWTTRLYKTFSGDVSVSPNSLTPVSSITRPTTASSRSRLRDGGADSETGTSGSLDSEKKEAREEGNAGDGQNDAAAWKPSRRTILVFSSLCILQLMVALDSTSIGTALSVRDV